MNQLKMIWEKYIAIFYFVYSVIIHVSLMIIAFISFFLAFAFLSEKGDLECSKTTMREIGGFILLLVIPFISFISRFLFLSKISFFNKMLEKKNLLTTGILDIITIFALFLFSFLYYGAFFSLEKDNFVLFFVALFFFLFFSNFVSILFFSFVQKFRSLKKTEIIRIIFFIIFTILNQLIGFLFLFSIVCLYAFFNWDNLSSSTFGIFSFVLVYSILFQIFDTKLCYYLKLIETDTIETKMLLLIKDLFFILIFLCTLWVLE